MGLPAKLALVSEGQKRSLRFQGKFMSPFKLDEEAIFDFARQIECHDMRSKYLEQACGTDKILRDRLAEMLGAFDKEQSYLEKPALDLSATTDAPQITEKPGEFVGAFKLLQRIGEGGFGVVYMAEQSTPVRRKVALKLIKPGMDTKEVIARFEAERQALAMMNHPNIAKVYDGGETASGRPYFVMELVKGVPLTKYCDEEKLDTQDRLKLFQTICAAIQHAHQKGVIHRDIKPSNVLITLHDGEPVPKVIDFGVAKAINQQLTEKTMFTCFGQMIGTPQYMSPEQAEMSGLDIDTRSDIYSLGVLLYELLTGSTPIQPERLRETGFAEMQRMIREEEPPKPSLRLSTQGEHSAKIAIARSSEMKQLGSLLRGELDWIVMKALEKNRDRRYETASGLAKDVQRYLEGEPVAACPPSFVYRFKKFSRKYRGVLVSVTSVLAVLGLATVFSTVLAIKANHARREANENLKAFEESNAELVEARGNEALENAIDQLLRGNVEESRKSLDVARTHGANPGKIALCNATLLFYEGSFDYVDELDNAIKHLPNSMATKVLMANTYRFGPLANLVKSNELDRQIEELTPKTTIDLLLAGQHFALREPDRAIEYLEELRRTHNSRLAFYELSRVYTSKVSEAYNDSNVEGFLKYADVAFQTMTNNKLAGRRYVYAHLAAADHFRLDGRLELEEYHVSKARLAAKSLVDEHPRASRSHQSLAAVHAYDEEWDEAITHALEANKYLDKAEGYANSVALMIRQGRAPNLDNCAEWLRCGELMRVLAVLHSNGALAARDSLQEWEVNNDRPLIGLEVSLLFEIRCLLGEPDAAALVADQNIDKSAHAGIFTEFRLNHQKYLAGRLSEEEVLPHVKRRIERQWHYAARGFKRLGEGKRGDAIRAFEQVEKEGKFVWGVIPEGFTSRALAYLHRLREAPTWPAWIPDIDSE